MRPRPGPASDWDGCDGMAGDSAVRARLCEATEEFARVRSSGGVKRDHEPWQSDEYSRSSRDPTERDRRARQRDRASRRPPKQGVIMGDVVWT